MTAPAKPADDKPDTACRKCKTPMPPMPPPDPQVSRMFGQGNFSVTAFRCKACGHWNSLKRRKPRKPAKP